MVVLGLLHFGAAGNPLEAGWLLLFPSSPPQAVSCDFAPCELNITVSVAFFDMFILTDVRWRNSAPVSEPLALSHPGL